MSTRESRKHKERRSVIPFGDIMLPVIGLVAVGILIVGVKLFFLSGERYKPYTPLPIQQDITKPSGTPVAAPFIKPAEPQRERSSEKLLAVPVIPGASKRDDAGGESPIASPPIAKPAEPIRPANARPSAPATQLSAPGNSRWGVQIGSFTARQSAETVQQQAKRAGFSAIVSTAQVKGRVYFRVTVPAGNARADAVTLSQRLTKAGFPVFVVSLQ